MPQGDIENLMEGDGFLCSFNKVRGSFVPGSENTEVKITPALPSWSVLCGGDHVQNVMGRRQDVYQLCDFGQVT